MKLNFEEESLSKKQECSALYSNLEGTALNCVMAKRANERDGARKIFDILLNRFRSTRAPGYGQVRKEASKG